MYQHILIATDGSELGTKALEHGLGLAKRDGARVTAWSPFDIARESREHRQPDPVGQFEPIATAAAKHILEGAAQKAKAIGVSCNCVHVKDRHPAEGSALRTILVVT